MIHRVRRPDTVRVITGDTAIQHEARLRKCQHTDAAAFVRELFASRNRSHTTVQGVPEKPCDVSPEEAREWIELFDIDDEEPFDGHDAMTR